ncbi:MAG: hypothetical protein RLZZ597_2304 [Cyanobacteriota bacterium]|jgi:hypothetical protein
MSRGTIPQPSNAIDALLRTLTMQRSANSAGVTTSQNSQRPDAEFDQWAKAVRQQMVAALKRRGNA